MAAFEVVCYKANGMQIGTKLKVKISPTHRTFARTARPSRVGHERFTNTVIIFHHVITLGWF